MLVKTELPVQQTVEVDEAGGVDPPLVRDQRERLSPAPVEGGAGRSDRAGDKGAHPTWPTWPTWPDRSRETTRPVG
jgi:hypothetical protein